MVPTNEKVFLLDQRTTRKMVFGEVDKKLTANVERRLLRKQNETKLISNANQTNQNADEFETAARATPPSTPLPTK